MVVLSALYDKNNCILDTDYGFDRMSTIVNSWLLERGPLPPPQNRTYPSKTFKFGYFPPFSLVFSPNLLFQYLFFTFFKTISWLKDTSSLFWPSQCAISASKCRTSQQCPTWTRLVLVKKFNSTEKSYKTHWSRSSIGPKSNSEQLYY